MAKHIAPLGQTMGQLCVWLQACRPYRTGERKGSGFFYKHIVPMGRGEKRLGWFFLVNMAARRDGGCSSGAGGLRKTLSLMKLVRRRCRMFVQKTAQAESRAVGCGMLFGQAAKPFSEHDFLGWQSILPRWGKLWVSFVLGYKHAVPTGRGKGRGLVSFTNISSRWDEG